jgi:hypothetical protein
MGTEMRIAATFALMTLAAGSPAGHQAVAAERANGHFDGRWLLEISTRQGACPSVYQTSFDIKAGRVVTFGERIANGLTIDRHGRVSLQLANGEKGLMARGRISKVAGAGSWSTSGAQCAGQWRATRS